MERSEHVKRLREELETKSRQMRALEIEVSVLKRRIARIEARAIIAAQKKALQTSVTEEAKPKTSKKPTAKTVAKKPAPTKTQTAKSPKTTAKRRKANV